MIYFLCSGSKLSDILHLFNFTSSFWCLVISLIARISILEIQPVFTYLNNFRKIRFLKWKMDFNQNCLVVFFFIYSSFLALSDIFNISSVFTQRFPCNPPSSCDAIMTTAMSNKGYNYLRAFSIPHIYSYFEGHWVWLHPRPSETFISESTWLTVQLLSRRRTSYMNLFPRIS